MQPAGLRFLDMPLFNGLVRAVGRRDLRPDVLVAYEIGYREKLFNRLDTNLNVFWHEYHDLSTISPRLGPPGLVCMDLDNRAAASMYGTEWEARYPVTQRLTLLANHTYQQPDWRSSAPFTDKEVITPPKHKSMIGVRYDPTDDLHLSSHLFYVDAATSPSPTNLFLKRKVDPYLRLDLLAEYELWHDTASVSLGVRNLLDSNHYEGGTLFLNDAEVPRMIYAEFRISIK